MELKRRFIFHGDAVAIGGRIVRPHDIILDPGCASALTVTGGRTTSRIKGMKFGKYVRFASASSLAEGLFDDRKQAVALTLGKVREEELTSTTTVRAELLGTHRRHQTAAHRQKASRLVRREKSGDGRRRDGCKTRQRRRDRRRLGRRTQTDRRAEQGSVPGARHLHEAQKCSGHRPHRITRNRPRNDRPKHSMERQTLSWRHYRWARRHRAGIRTDLLRRAPDLERLAAADDDEARPWLAVWGLDGLLPTSRTTEGGHRRVVVMILRRLQALALLWLCVSACTRAGDSDRDPERPVSIRQARDVAGTAQRSARPH